MRTNIVRILVALAMISSLVGIAVAPAVAQQDPDCDCGPGEVGVALTSYQGPVGSAITVTVTCANDGQPVTVEFDGVGITTSPSTVTVGDEVATQASCQIQIPAAITGEHTITVNVGFDKCKPTFIVDPEVKASPDEGPVGSSVTVTGTGFGWDSPVTADVYIVPAGGAPFVDGRVLATGVTVDDSGGFSVTAPVPAGLAAGPHDVYAIDGAANEATAANAFEVTPTVSVSPTHGLAGSEVTIKGAGWVQGGGDVDIDFAGAFWVTVTTLTDGKFEVDTTVPISQGSGTKAVQATQSGVQPASTSFTIDPRPLVLTPSSGPMGIDVRVQCDDLTPSGEVAAGDLEISGQDLNGQDITINSGGTMSATEVTIPGGLTVGSNPVTLEDSGGLTASGIFTVTKPAISVNPTVGPWGTMITITGTGWAPDETVTLRFKEEGIGAALASMTSKPDSNGNFGAAMNVPKGQSRGEKYTIEAEDNVGNKADEVAYTVPAAAIELDPTTGVPGMEQVTISGTGFDAYTSVTIEFGTAIFADKPLTDKFGMFEYTATIPGQPEGSTMVRAYTGDSINPVDEATEFFAVEAAPDTVSSAMATIEDSLVRVWGYHGGEWQMYDPDDTVGSDLLSLTSGRGYWVKVDADCELIFGGSSWDLVQGWNNIGWM